MTGSQNENSNINKLKNSVMVVDIKLADFKYSIDTIISNIINERQATIQRKDYDEVKEDHGPKVELDTFNSDIQRE